MLPGSWPMSSPDQSRVGPNVPVVLPNSTQQAHPTTNVDKWQPKPVSELSKSSEVIKSSSNDDVVQRHKGKIASDGIIPTTGDTPAMIKRRAQVVDAAKKAKERITLLGLDSFQKQNRRKKSWSWLLQLLFSQKALQNFFDFFDKRKEWLNLWVGSLIAMEGRFGSAVMLTFAFLRWVFLLNILLSLLWFAAVILPFMQDPPASFKWSLFLLNKKNSSLDNTFLFYGGYNYTAHEQKGWYRTDYMYACTLVAMFFLSLVAVLGRIVSRIMGTGDVSIATKSVIYPFSTLVFASWDFHITSLERFLALFVLWPLVMVATSAMVVIALAPSTQLHLKGFLKDYGQAIFFTILNIVGPMIVRLLVALEDWKPATAERVVLTKLFFLRVLNLGAFAYRSFEALQSAQHVREGKQVDCLLEKCREGTKCCTNNLSTTWLACTPSKIGYCVAACAENIVAKQIMRLIVTTTVVNNAYELLYGYFIVLCYHTTRQLYIEDMAIDIVYVQALVWVGSCFTPIASILGALSNCVTFYCMRVTLMRTCGPLPKSYSASRTSYLTYGLLLATLVICSVPLTYKLTVSNNGVCGPILEAQSMYSVLADYIKRGPHLVSVTLQWLGNPFATGEIVLLLIFGITLLKAKLVRSHQYMELTARELDLQRQEVRERLTFMHLQGSSTSTPLRQHQL
ncbi:hypothetical protein O6H91_08G100000 [Diphasiastrum complanatum]|uniref:Uncharacterized protein n=1 Tax=Diphasiastrum complanatum TaxID=34168 RepID=A0ACC2D0F4_DIPCM|nr:hypothetical protein O6H91_08G100000 [Diphasiastrum complanatum]